MPSIQKQISLIFNKKKQQIFVDYFTYQRIRTQVFNYPKKYQNNFTYYIDLDNNYMKLQLKIMSLSFIIKLQIMNQYLML